MRFIPCGLHFPSTYLSVGLVWFHNFLNSWLFGVLIYVTLVFLFLYFEGSGFKIPGMSYSTAESLCAIVPIIIIFVQMLPSMFFLFMMTVMDTSSDLTVKVIGHQWYWHYELLDSNKMEFDSFMKASDDLALGDSRMFSVDSNLLLPTHTNIRFVFTSADVIHSWALPSAGIKVDCAPGLLNCLTVNFSLVGVYYGQCSEICGSSHSFMPIVVELTNWKQFHSWMLLQQ